MAKVSNTMNNSFTYGVIAGFALIIFSLLLYFTNLMFYKPFLINSLINYLIVIVLMLAGTKNLRDKLLNGTITFGGAFLSAFMIGLIAMVISIIFSDILTYIIDPGLQDKAMQMQADKWLHSGRMTQDQVDSMLEKQKQMSGKWWVFLIGQFAILFVSGIVVSVLSLITAAIQKKEGDPFKQDMQGVN
jgi:hypothetical protein